MVRKTAAFEKSVLKTDLRNSQINPRRCPTIPQSHKWLFHSLACRIEHGYFGYSSLSHNATTGDITAQKMWKKRGYLTAYSTAAAQVFGIGGRSKILEKVCFGISPSERGQRFGAASGKEKVSKRGADGRGGRDNGKE
jgi:hypothetical protein